MNLANDKLPKYNALFDNNLRHHFENKKRQKQLQRLGLINRHGQAIDLEKHRAKLFIIEQEFKQAEKAEYWQRREEQEMRVRLLRASRFRRLLFLIVRSSRSSSSVFQRRVQKKRHEALEKARLKERLEKIKEDRRIRKEILKLTSPHYDVMKSSKTSPGKEKKKKTKKSRKTSKPEEEQDSSFFITEAARQSALDSIDLDGTYLTTDDDLLHDFS